jgi:hypothetical protein
MARRQTHRHHVFGLEKKALVRNDPELYLVSKANSRALGILFDQFVRSDNLTPHDVSTSWATCSQYACAALRLSYLSIPPLGFVFSRSPGPTNATIFGKSTGEFSGHNRNFAEWSKIDESPWPDAPFLAFFHCIYGAYMIFRISFQRRF